MPAISQFTIYDGATTPLAHAFDPVGIRGEIASYEDRATGVSIGYPTTTLSVVKPSKTSKLCKVRVKIVLPVMEVLSNNTMSGINPAPTKAFDLTFDGVFILPQRAGVQNRKDILALMRSFFDSANTTTQPLVDAAVIDEEGVY